MSTLATKKAALRQKRADWQTLYESRPNHDYTADEMARLKSWHTEMNDLGVEIEQLEGIQQIQQSYSGGGAVPFVDDGRDWSEKQGGTPFVPKCYGDKDTTFGEAFIKAGFDIRNRPAVTVPLSQAFEQKTLIYANAEPSTWYPMRDDRIHSLGVDRRYLWPYLRAVDAGEVTAIEAFHQAGSRTITGSVERAIDAVTDKAVISAEIKHVVTELKMFAVVIEDVPTQLTRSIPAMVEFLADEGRTAIANAIDAHVVATIQAASAPVAGVGANLVAMIRNGLAAARLTGNAPNLLVLNPTDSAALDLMTDAGGYVFDAFTARTLWGMQIVEVAHSTPVPPMLIDTTRLGTLHRGTVRLEADPYTGLKQNTVDFRLEGTGLFVVHDPAAAYLIDTTP